MMAAQHDRRWQQTLWVIWLSCGNGGWETRFDKECESEYLQRRDKNRFVEKTLSNKTLLSNKV